MLCESRPPTRSLGSFPHLLRAGGPLQAASASGKRRRAKSSALTSEAVPAAEPTPIRVSTLLRPDIPEPPAGRKRPCNLLSLSARHSKSARVWAAILVWKKSFPCGRRGCGDESMSGCAKRLKKPKRKQRACGVVLTYGENGAVTAHRNARMLRFDSSEG